MQHFSNILEQWVDETSCSAMRMRVKELNCYITIASWAQAHQKRILDPNGEDLGHTKIISMSAILCGSPGSYKSEAVKCVKDVLEAYNALILRLDPAQQQHHAISIYPHDKCTNEMLMHTLAQHTHHNPPNAPTAEVILVDELVTFLNRRDYVEPLVGTLNNLFDQPKTYSSGTIKRGTEEIRRPLCVFYAACAPSWFKYLPESLFSGGFTGRCLFYYTPYPADEDRNPRGRRIDPKGGAERIAERLWDLDPKQPIQLSREALKIHDGWEREFGREHWHPLQHIDEWAKRRTILATRLAACVALSNGSYVIREEHMFTANLHMLHVLETLEIIWSEVDSDDYARIQLLNRELAAAGAVDEEQLTEITLKIFKAFARGRLIVDHYKNTGILTRTEEKLWLLRKKRTS